MSIIINPVSTYFLPFPHKCIAYIHNIIIHIGGGGIQATICSMPRQFRVEALVMGGLTSQEHCGREGYDKEFGFHDYKISLSRLTIFILSPKRGFRTSTVTNIHSALQRYKEKMTYASLLQEKCKLR